MSTSPNRAPETPLSPRPDAGYYLWGPAGSPVSVRLNLDVIDRLGADVTNKFTDLTGRGSEIGGILLGRTTNGNNRTFFVEDYELIECDYSDSPLFSLSDESKSRMVEQLHRLKTSSPHAILGFFRSHTRKNLSLDENDLTLIRDYFAGPATVFLLIKPFAAKPSTAGFFVWENGEIRTEESYCQFPFKRAELVVRMPEAIVESGSDRVAPALSRNSQLDDSPHEESPRRDAPQDTPHRDGEAAPAATPVPRPTRVGRTNAELQRSLDDIIKQISRDPTEKKVFSAGMDLERERERWSRFALESSIVSQPKPAAAPIREDTNPSPAEPEWESRGPVEPRPPDESWQAAPNSLAKPPKEKSAGNAGPKFEGFSSLPPSPDEGLRRDYDAPVPGVVHSGWIRLRWVWASLIIVLFMFGGGYVGARMAGTPATPAAPSNTLDLKLDRAAGSLVLQWNRGSSVIATAKNAVLRIEDGNQSKDFDLSLEQLRFGKIVYFPAGENVNFRLEVIDAGGSRSVSEWVRTAGVPVTATLNRVH